VTPPADRSSAVGERAKRLALVTLVAALAVVVAVYSLAYGILVLQTGEHPLAHGIFHLGLGVGALAAGVRAPRLNRWPGPRS
jgi:hypothetical protein